MKIIKLRSCLTIVALIEPPAALVDRGDRLDFIPISGGHISGDVEAEILPGGGDWCLTRTDGVINVEARYLARTPTGGIIDIHNVGVLRPSVNYEPNVLADGYFLTTPRFRTVARSCYG